MAFKVVAAIVPIGASCSRETIVEQGSRGSSDLTVEDARGALIELVESSDNIVLRMSLDFLRTAPAEKQAQGWVEIGAWRINLGEQSFGVTATGQDSFEDYGGKFLRGEKGRWHAQITESRQT